MVSSTTRRKLPPILKSFAIGLRNRIGAEKVLLFGSYARGLAAPDSDFDLIIVSSNFVGIRERERDKGLREIFYELGGHAPMDLICLTPAEFEKARTGINLVAAVLPEAIELLPAKSTRVT
jgi:predicted nucleotidyltransferase